MSTLDWHLFSILSQALFALKLLISIRPLEGLPIIFASSQI